MTGSELSVEALSTDPHPLLRGLRATEPVAWVDALGCWLVTSHELCLEVMLDSDTFTVDDPRFSTGQVIGPSMLSLDGAEHRRHRDPFAGPFRAAKVRELSDFARQTADELVGQVVSNGSGDLRSDVAGPLAVAAMARVLDLRGVGVSEVLGWYGEIVDAVHAVTAGYEVPTSGLEAFAGLKQAVVRDQDSSGLLADGAGTLTVDEVASNVAVLLFGGVVTSESSASIAFRYLLADPGLRERLENDRSQVRTFVDETFRLEPSAAAVDRYATRAVTLDGAEISEGDLVRVSLSGANRDPAVFAAPDSLDIGRSNLAKNLTFARGPHVCLGVHLARLETVVAVEAVLDHSTLVSAGDAPVDGLVFRAPEAVPVRTV